MHICARMFNPFWHAAVWQVAVVALPQCHWSDGSTIDLEEVAKVCQKHNIPLVLDLTQSVGMMPIDVRTLQPAFLCASVHKWLLGPYGFRYGAVAQAYARITTPTGI